MKALSLHQPWAYFIRTGEKTIETRFWGTSYRGPVLICSTKTFDNMSTVGGRYYHTDVRQDLGTMQCIVDIVDCHVALDADTEGACCCVEAVNPRSNKLERKHAIVLANPRPVERAPVKCGRRWFDVPDDQIKLIDPSTFPERPPFKSLPLDEFVFVKPPKQEDIQRAMDEGLAAREAAIRSHVVPNIDPGLRFR